MARIRIPDVTHPETGEVFHVTAHIFKDGLVLTDVYRYTPETCLSCGAASPTGRHVVDGGTFRGYVLGKGRNWRVESVGGAAFPVTFKTRRAAVLDTVGLALDVRDLKGAS